MFALGMEGEITTSWKKQREQILCVQVSVWLERVFWCRAVHAGCGQEPYLGGKEQLVHGNEPTAPQLSFSAV